MNVGAARAFRMGSVRAFRNWRLWLVFYLINFVFAAILTIPIASLVSRDLSNRLVGQELLSGFCYRWYVEFAHGNAPFFSALLPQIVFLIVLYILVDVFLAGGFFTSFAASEKVKIGVFLSNGSTKFFDILLVTLIEVALLMGLYKLNSLFDLIGGTASNRIVATHGLWRVGFWRYAVLLVLFGVINILSDFSKAAMALDDDTFLSKLTRGVTFVIRHPLSTGGVYIGATILSTAVIAAAFLPARFVPSSGEAGILVEVAAGQIIVLLRIFSKLIFYAGEAVLYKENQIEVIKVKPEMLE